MRAIVAAVQRPSVSDAEFDASLAELRQLAKTLGFEVVGNTSAQFGEFLAAELARWKTVIEVGKITADP